MLAAEIEVVSEPQRGGLDRQLGCAREDVTPPVEQLGRGDLEEPELIEEPQQPGLGEGRRPSEAIPDRHGATDELVPARALHTVDAQIGAADPDGVLGRPGPSRVVLRRHEPVTGIQRRGDRSAEVDVAQPQYEIGRVEHGPVYVGDRVEPVDAPDELDVPRAPRRVGPHRRRVTVDRLTRRGIVPGKWKVDGAAVDDRVGRVGQLVLGCLQRSEQRRTG